MADFKNKEDYEKWKAERLNDPKKREEARLETIRQDNKRLEEEKLSKLWICPECSNANDNSATKCQCGYTPDAKYCEYFGGNLTSAELYEIITDKNLKDDDKEVFLSFYLLKRFPDSKESTKIKKWMDYDSKEVVCGKCGSNNIYNLKFYKKDTCEKCGDFLYQYIKKDIKRVASRKEEVSNKDLVSFMSVILTVIGVIFLIYSLTMRTSVITDYGDYVHNVGLLNRKQNFTIVASLMVLIGIVLIISSAKKRK